jgi:hypothetical protein
LRLCPTPELSGGSSRPPATGESLPDDQAEAVEQPGDAVELEVQAVARGQPGQLAGVGVDGAAEV